MERLRNNMALLENSKQETNDYKDILDVVLSDEDIKALESNWSDWKTKDAMKWFHYILSKCGDKYSNIDSSGDDSDTDSDSNSDASSSGDSESDNDDEKSSKEINYNLIEQRLNQMRFRGKRNLPAISTVKSSLFHGYGFKNSNDCRILYKATKDLMKKYPKKNKKKNKKEKRHKK